MKSLAKPDKYAEVKEIIYQIYHEHKGRYGYRRVTLELRNRGYTLNHKTVQRLMRQLKLKSLVRVKRYRSYRGQVGELPTNLLQRNFKADRPCQKWVTDISEFQLLGQKVYLSAMLDLYNGEIVAYCYSAHPRYALVDTMLQKALPLIPEQAELIIHSDQGWHYQMKRYQHELGKQGIHQSMSRKGNCLDNAVIENFFGLLKSEMFYLQEFQTIEEFLAELDAYMLYYNTIRIKSKLKGLSPVQYRIQSSTAA